MHEDTRIHFSEKEVLRSGTAGSWVGVCLTLLEIARVFFSVVGPFYTPTSNKEAFIHANILDNSWDCQLLKHSLSDGCVLESLCNFNLNFQVTNKEEPFFKYVLASRYLLSRRAYPSLFPIYLYYYYWVARVHWHFGYNFFVRHVHDGRLLRQSLIIPTSRFSQSLGYLITQAKTFQAVLKEAAWTPLGVKWLRICLPMQGIWANPQSRKTTQAMVQPGPWPQLLKGTSRSLCSAAEETTAVGTLCSTASGESHSQPAGSPPHT